MLLLNHFSRVWLCATPKTAAQQAPLSLGFSRQEHWSGLSFPSPIHESEKWKWSRSVVSDSLWPRGLQPTRLLHQWDFPDKSTGVGCHRLLQNVSIPLLKAIEYTTSRVSPNVNSGLLVKMWYQSKFIDCNKCTLWCRMLIVEEVMCVCMERGRYENSLYFALNFSLSLKLLPNIKSIKKLKKIKNKCSSLFVTAPNL